MKLRVSFDDKVKEYDLNRIDYDINMDSDEFRRLHIRDRKTGEVLLSLSLRRNVTIEIIVK